MKITMLVNLEVPLDVDESAVARPLPEPIGSELRRMPYLGGQLKLHEDGEEPTVIYDDLEQLVPRLCVASLTQLHAGQEVTVPLFTDAGQVVLRPRGSQLEVVLSDGRSANFILVDALAALEACGRRYMRLVQLNFPEDASRRMKLAPVKLELLRRQNEREAATEDRQD